MDNNLVIRIFFFSNYDRDIGIIEIPFSIIVSKDIIELKEMSQVN